MIVTFGEILLKLAAPQGSRLSQANSSMNASFGGGEYNTAVSLSCLGKRTRHITGLPDNPLGRACLGEMRRAGVDTSAVVLRPGRLGIYFCEYAGYPRSIQVLYDRANSVTARLEPAAMDWDAAFDGARWFHFSGITPALGPSLPDITLEACRAARERGLTVSCDLNYRGKLWTPERARQVMGTLLPYVDIVIASEDEIETILGIRGAGEGAARMADIGAKVCGQMDISALSVMERRETAAETSWQCFLYIHGRLYASKDYRFKPVDPMGAGDAYCAGLIYALSEDYAPQRAVEFAAAAGCLKHTIAGDANLAIKEEIAALAESEVSGGIAR